jgi:hypothetical protein
MIMAVFGIPWLAKASPQLLPPSSHGLLPVWISVFRFLLFIRAQLNGIRELPCSR